ncbi:MAG: dihydroxyacetone kinase subunit DhaL, partial [Acidimicrobiia bacterium]
MATGTVTLDQLRRWVLDFASAIEESKDHLTRLDSAIGDADHGINMDRGMKAVVAKIGAEPAVSVDALFKSVGMTLVSSVGGASGPLYGTFFLRFGMASGESDSLSAADLAKAFRSGLDGVVARGKAEAGDKTMFDALNPAIEALDSILSGGGQL